MHDIPHPEAMLTNLCLGGARAGFAPVNATYEVHFYFFQLLNLFCELSRLTLSMILPFPLSL
jgi:hypothetical protein